MLNFYDVLKDHRYYRRSVNKLECHLPDEVVTCGNTKFLDYIALAGAELGSELGDTVTAYAVTELARRGKRLSEEAYKSCKARFTSDEFTFEVLGKPHRYCRVKLAEVRSKEIRKS